MVCLGVHWSLEYDVERNWTLWHRCDGCTEGVYLHLPNSCLGAVLMVCITSFSQEPVGQVQALLLGGKQDSERTFPSHHDLSLCSVIGSHHSTELPAMYGFQGCFWPRNTLEN